MPAHTDPAHNPFTTNVNKVPDAVDVTFFEQINKEESLKFYAENKSAQQRSVERTKWLFLRNEIKRMFNEQGIPLTVTASKEDLGLLPFGKHDFEALISLLKPFQDYEAFVNNELLKLYNLIKTIDSKNAEELKAAIYRDANAILAFFIDGEIPNPEVFTQVKQQLDIIEKANKNSIPSITETVEALKKQYSSIQIEFSKCERVTINLEKNIETVKKSFDNREMLKAHIKAKFSERGIHDQELETFLNTLMLALTVCVKQIKYYLKDQELLKNPADYKINYIKISLAEKDKQIKKDVKEKIPPEIIFSKDKKHYIDHRSLSEYFIHTFINELQHSTGSTPINQRLDLEYQKDQAVQRFNHAIYLTLQKITAELNSDIESKEIGKLARKIQTEHMIKKDIQFTNDLRNPNRIKTNQETTDERLKKETYNGELEAIRLFEDLVYPTSRSDSPGKKDERSSLHKFGFASPHRGRPKSNYDKKSSEDGPIAVTNPLHIKNQTDSRPSSPKPKRS